MTTLSKEVIDALTRARETAMHQTLCARIPESGKFGDIAQDLDYALTTIISDVVPYGSVTTTRTGCQTFYPWPDRPYLDTAVECEVLYRTPRIALDSVITAHASTNWFALIHLVNSGCSDRQLREFIEDKLSVFNQFTNSN